MATSEKWSYLARWVLVVLSAPSSSADIERSFNAMRGIEHMAQNDASREACFLLKFNDHFKEIMVKTRRGDKRSRAAAVLPLDDEAMVEDNGAEDPEVVVL